MSAEPHGHGLIAAYALNALDSGEVELVEQHLAECDDCLHDLREFRRTTARLAAANAVPTDDQLWDRIRSRVEQVPQLSAVSTTPRADEEPTAHDRVVPLRRRRAVRVLSAAAAFLLVVTVGLSVLLVSTNRDLDELRAQSDKVSALLAATDLERTASEMDPGAVPVVVYTSRDMDTAMLMVEGLDPAPDGMGYQVWYVEPDDTMRSAGMLKTMDADTMSIVCTGLGDTAQLGITMEPMRGADHPSKPPMKIDV